MDVLMYVYVSNVWCYLFTGENMSLIDDCVNSSALISKLAEILFDYLHV